MTTNMKSSELKEALAKLCGSPSGLVRPDAAVALASVLAGVVCSETRGQEAHTRWWRFNSVDTQMRDYFDAYLEQEE
jgi:hypothetical protein